MEKSVTITVSLSTDFRIDPSRSEGSRYFCDMRDTTHGKPGRQMTTRNLLERGVYDFIDEVKRVARVRAEDGGDPVRVTVVDETLPGTLKL
jgi:hypothetical protein